MKLIINCFAFIGCFAAILSCTPDDPAELAPSIDPSQFQYSVTQEAGHDNKVFLESRTPGVIPMWDYEIGTSNQLQDTIVIPFKGDFWVKYNAFGGLMTSTDSTMITVSQFDPTFFADPVWQNLTNGELGYRWKLVAVKAGDSQSKTYNDWGDAGWLTAALGDSAEFNLDKKYNYIRYTNGVPTKSTFTLDLNEVLPDAYLNTPGKALVINDGNKMPADDAGEMTASNKNRFRILKLSNDTLILGQGGYYTSDQQNKFTYFFWYIRTK